jgi:hypothetical protein
MRSITSSAVLAFIVVAAALAREQKTTVRVPMRDGVHPNALR